MASAGQQLGRVNGVVVSNDRYYHSYVVSDLRGESLPLSKLHIRIFARGFAVVKGRDYLTFFEPYHEHLLENLEEADFAPTNIWEVLAARLGGGRP